MTLPIVQREDIQRPFDYSLARRMADLRPSPFQLLQRATREAENRGRKLLYLSVGEPGFPTPEHVKETAIRAIQSDQTRYTATDGTPELKRAIQHKLLRDNTLSYREDEITVTMGGVQAIFNILQATVAAGDEVILPAPFFSPYLSSIALSGATPIILPTRQEDGYIPQANDIAAAITPRTRWLILNSPSNPTGAIIGPDHLAEIAQVVADHPRLLVFSDDMYEAIRFDPAPFENIVNVVPEFRNRTVILNGVSKAYSMTGWRMAYLAGPRDLIEAVTQVSNSSAFAPNSISQAAAVAALTGSQSLIRTNVDDYRAKRDLVVRSLKNIPGLTFTIPQGTFFLFVNCESFLGTRNSRGKLIADDVDFVLNALEEADVAIMPGSGFGMSGHFRISFATAADDLTEAVDRLRKICADLTRDPS